MQLQQPVSSSLPSNYAASQMQSMPVPGSLPPIQSHYPQQSRGRRRFSGMKPKLVKLGAVVVVLAILGLLAANLYFVINPPFLKDLLWQQQVVEEVATLTTVNLFERPTINIIKDIDTIKEQSEINAQVFKDSRNGDYLLAYNDRIIVYRREDKKLVYNGDSPVQILQKRRQEVYTKALAKARDQKIITVADDKIVNPAVEEVTNADTRKTQDPAFFADLKIGDVIVSFPAQKLVIIYRPSTDTIVNVADVQFAAR